MYLTRLAADETEVDERYISFLESYITTADSLIKVIKVLKCKLQTDNLEDYFEPLRSYISQYTVKRSTVLKTSHVFCECCDLYTPSFLGVWVRNNPELFDTEVNFYYRFMKHFGTLIKSDAAAYPLEELYVSEDTPLSGQTNREKLKLLSSVVKYYEYIVNT